MNKQNRTPNWGCSIFICIEWMFIYFVPFWCDILGMSLNMNNMNDKSYKYANVPLIHTLASTPVTNNARNVRQKNYKLQLQTLTYISYQSHVNWILKNALPSAFFMVFSLLTNIPENVRSFASHPLNLLRAAFILRIYEPLWTAWVVAYFIVTWSAISMNF